MIVMNVVHVASHTGTGWTRNQLAQCVNSLSRATFYRYVKWGVYEGLFEYVEMDNGNLAVVMTDIGNSMYMSQLKLGLEFDA